MLKKNTYLSSTYTDVLVAKSDVNSISSFKLPVMRAGSLFGDSSRCGTWYEIILYEGQASRYQVGGFAKAVHGVGGKQLHYRTVTVNDPYFFNYEGSGDSMGPVKLAEKVLGKDKATKLKKGITGGAAEKSYAMLEYAVAEELAKRGFDSVIFYIETPCKLWNATIEGLPSSGECWRLDQLFKFDLNRCSPEVLKYGQQLLFETKKKGQKSISSETSLLEKQLFAEVDNDLLRLAEQYKINERQDTYEFNMWFDESFSAIDHLLLDVKYKDIYKVYGRKEYNWAKYVLKFFYSYNKKLKSLPLDYKKYEDRVRKEIVSIGIAYAYTLGLKENDFDEVSGKKNTKEGNKWIDRLYDDFVKLRLNYGLPKLDLYDPDFEDVLIESFDKYSKSLSNKNAKDINFEKSVLYLAYKYFHTIYESRLPLVVRNYVKDIKFIPSYGSTSKKSTIDSALAYVSPAKLGNIYLKLDGWIDKDESFLDYDLGKVIAHEVWHLFRFKSSLENKLSAYLNMLLNRMYNFGSTVLSSIEDVSTLLNKYKNKSFKIGDITYRINSFQDFDEAQEAITKYRRDTYKFKKEHFETAGYFDPDKGGLESEYKKLIKEENVTVKIGKDLDAMATYINSFLRRLTDNLSDSQKSFKKEMKPYLSFMQNLLYASDDANSKDILDLVNRWGKDTQYFMTYVLYEMNVEGVKKMTKKYTDYLNMLKGFIANINTWVGRLDELLAENFALMVSGRKVQNDFVIVFLNQLFMSKAKVNQKVIFNKFIDLGIL